VLYDDKLHLKGSTETARLRRIPALVDEVTQQVSEGYSNLPTMTGGTDVVGQLRGDQEYLAQLGSGYSLWSITATDGLQTAGVQWRKLTDSSTAEAQADGLPSPTCRARTRRFSSSASATRPTARPRLRLRLRPSRRSTGPSATALQPSGATSRPTTPRSAADDHGPRAVGDQGIRTSA
jgi:hypothetical protein